MTSINDDIIIISAIYWSETTKVTEKLVRIKLKLK